MHSFQKEFLDLPSSSDKLTHHGYHRIYPWFLAHFRNTPVKLLEIGLHQTESLKLWKNYFSDLKLYGIDINEKKFDDEKVSIFKVDQSNAKQLDEFAEKIKVDFTIIVDDGSHVPDHQILTLSKLWKKLVPGGVYIIEDIETSYWGESRLYGYLFNAHRFSAMDKLVAGIPFVNYEFIDNQVKKKLNEQELNSIFKEIEIISFACNCIILVKKDATSFGQFYRDTYRHKKRIDKFSRKKKLRKKLRNLLNRFMLKK